MFSTRIHGRGGQGVVTASELIAHAAFADGQHAQAFPSFGSERTGAPVVAYCRISATPIRTREPIAVPDALIIQDATLLSLPEVLAGLPQDGYVLVNSSKTFDELGLAEFAATHQQHRLLTVPATEVAMRHLGRPLPNAVLLGGFAAMTDQVRIDSVVDALLERFPGRVGDRNAAGAREAYERVSAQRDELAGAR